MLTHCVLPGFDPSPSQAGANFRADKSTLLSRATLLGSVAAATLFIVAPQQSAQAGPAVCTLSGTTVTCTGDQSDGIASGPDFTAPPVDTLIVEDLTGAIAPDPGDAGIYFEVPDGSNITISSDTGGFGISTTGNDAEGIYGYVDGDGNVAITSTGSVSTLGDYSVGIYGFVDGDGNVAITSTGNLSTKGYDSDGIIGFVDDAGNVAITSTGSVSTLGDYSVGIIGFVGGDGNVAITSTGSVSTLGEYSEGIYGIVRGEGNVSITSTGRVSTQGDASKGIYGLADSNGNVFITNTGRVSTLGRDANGIYGYASGNGDVSITSTGDISTQKASSEGIYGRVFGEGNISITSTGRVSTQGNQAEGIIGYGEANGNVSITSAGDITTSGTGSEGIFGYVGGNGDVTITDTGNVSTAGNNADGIIATIVGNGNLTITNTGDVTAALAAGISADVDGTGSITITHSGSTISGTTGIDVQARTSNAPATLNLLGTVTGTGGTAIDFKGDGHDSVNLHAGAVINGVIDFGNGNDGMGGTNPDDIDTLNAGPGFNGVIDFTDFESAPENINGKFVLTNGGIQAVFADISSGLAANAVMLDDLVGSILGGIEGQNADVVETQGSASGDQALGYAPLKKPTNMDRFDVFDEIKPSYRVWGTGFGALTGQKGTATTLSSDIGIAGGMVGVETAVQADFVAGFFLGRSMSRIDVAFNSMDMETGSTFAGVYTRHNWDETWLNFTLLGGWSDHDDVRYVGATQARADYDSFFVAPAVTLGTRLSGILPDHDVLPSLRVNYTGQFIEGYTETGVALPLSVSSRNVHLLSSRAQIAVPYNWTQSDGTAFKIEGVVGVDGTLNLGDDIVQTTIAGSPLDFSTKFANASASGFVGASFNLLSADNRYAFNTSAEGHLDIDGSLALRGNVSVSGRF